MNTVTSTIYLMVIACHATEGLPYKEDNVKDKLNQTVAYNTQKITNA